MASEGETRLAEAGRPAVSCADGDWLVEKPVAFFLSGESGELVPARVVVGHEQFLAVQDRWVRRLSKVAKAHVEAAEASDDDRCEGGMGVVIEGWVAEVRDLGLLTVQLQEGGVVDCAGQRAGAAFVDAQDCREARDGCRMGVERLGSQLPEGARSAGEVDGFGVAGREEQPVGFNTSSLVVPEEVAGVVLKIFWQLGEAGPTTERGEGQVDEEVLAGSSFEVGPSRRAGDPTDERKRSPDAAERLVDCLAMGNLALPGQSAPLGHEGDERLEELAVHLEAAFTHTPPDAKANVGPSRRASHSADERERSSQAAELSGERPAGGQLRRVGKPAMFLHESL